MKLFDVEIAEGGGHFFVLAGTLEAAIKKAVLARKREYLRMVFEPIIISAKMLEGRAIR